MSAAMGQWWDQPNDPDLADAAVQAYARWPEIGEMVLQRQAAFDPNVHLVVDDTFPGYGRKRPYVVFCTRGHGFTGATPAEAFALAEEHVRSSKEA